MVKPMPDGQGDGNPMPSGGPVVLDAPPGGNKPDGTIVKDDISGTFNKNWGKQPKPKTPPKRPKGPDKPKKPKTPKKPKENIL